MSAAKPLPWYRRLWCDARATSVIEFALGAPLLMTMGGYGVEISNLAVTNMRVSQYALQLADNASRIGVNSGLATYSLREGDINDVLQGARLFGAGAQLTKYGRVTLSSLENVTQPYDTDPSTATQRIHWQRCIGMKSGTGFDVSQDNSLAGQESTAATPADGQLPTLANAGKDAPSGMGDVGKLVNAPAGTAVMVVEINYQYQPLFGTLFVKSTKLHYVASMIVRDRRDYRQIYNPTPKATASTCNNHNA
jgi:hypothetical protein